MRELSYPADVRSRLRHVRFIGGGSGAGKSTVARRLAGELDLQLYETEPISQFVSRTSPSSAPLLHAFMRMDMDERWLNRSPHVMLDTFHGFQGELFHLIVEDLLKLPASPPVLSEGFMLLPRLVAPLLSRPDQAVWLIPTPEFRRSAFESRGTTWDIAGRTSDPERALANLLARDHLFTEQVEREAVGLGLSVIHVDPDLSAHRLRVCVAEVLGLPPVHGA